MLDLTEDDGRTRIRLYGWAPHCLSFGAHEPARRRYDRDRIRSLRLDCVRRPTGGRAVWHARELTYAVAGPGAVLGSLPDAYRRIHRWLAGALVRLGAEPVLAPARRAPGPDAGPCFAQAVGGEVVVAGRKVLGSAQRRGERALLQHGSLLLEDDQSQVRHLLAAPGNRTPPEAAPEAPLARLLGRPLPFATAARAVAEAFGAEGLGPFSAGTPNDVLERAALHFDHYRSDQWTWQR